MYSVSLVVGQFRIIFSVFKLNFAHCLKSLEGKVAEAVKMIRDTGSSDRIFVGILIRPRFKL